MSCEVGSDVEKTFQKKNATHFIAKIIASLQNIGPISHYVQMMISIGVASKAGGDGLINTKALQMVFLDS